MRAGHDAGNDLDADAVDRRGVEARLLHRQRQQVERLVALFGQHAHRAVDRVAAGAEAHLGAGIVELRLEGVAVEIAGAFVEQAGHQLGQPFLAGRVLRGAALEGEADRDDRHRIVLDQPGGDALVALDLLDGDLGRAPEALQQQWMPATIRPPQGCCRLFEIDLVMWLMSVLDRLGGSR